MNLTEKQRQQQEDSEKKRVLIESWICRGKDPLKVENDRLPVTCWQYPNTIPSWIYIVYCHQAFYFFRLENNAPVVTVDDSKV